MVVGSNLTGFVAAESSLKPMISNRNELFSCSLLSESNVDWQRYRI